MSFPATRLTQAPKGKFKCFKCRISVSARDGAWQVKESQQVFICGECTMAVTRAQMRPTTRKVLAKAGEE